MTKKDSALRAIGKACDAIEAELALSACDQVFRSRAQADMMLGQLREMRTALEQPMPVSGSTGGLGRIIADSFPFDSETALAILAAVEAYNRARHRRHY
ncbi:hypothetical protein EDD52_12348 [Primorskyibacter sedentarius]|uniref:Tsi6 domain-containing protein n=1 Tax=Primorskyibacter sedentarius TaxID=745311 RepID=A0A4R3J2X0_9RHOB|nr:hypothetical protein [Primorskyibacter sedentarius]TCS59018.1 hypothetical protein EDD52_12348 [Primorskyibacter sedentarius]